MITVVVGKEIEKIKGDFESYLNGLNMVGEISYSQYSKLYDEGTKQIQKAYKLGKSELEAQISNLLSCKNCPENKGGYICEKEYEGKCLTQKTQYIKELKEEIKKWKDEWQEQVQKENDESYARTLQTMKLDRAKEIIKSLYFIIQGRIDYENNIGIADEMWRAKQFWAGK